MENINFNDAIKNVKSFSSPNNNENLIQNNNKNSIKNSPCIDFSFKKNLKNDYDKEEKNINTKEANENKNEKSTIYSKDEENIFSSGNFGIKLNKKCLNDENINISNFSIFKESNKSKFSPFDNYLYSSSSIDNMDYHYTNKFLINNNINNSKEISPFLLPFSNKDNKDKRIQKEDNIYNFNHNDNNEFTIRSNIDENHQLNSLNKEYITKEFTKIKELKGKISHKKSCNKYIILNDTSFQKELNFLFKQFCDMSLSKGSKEDLVLIENRKENYEPDKNNLHRFPKSNNYVSIRKVFADITNKNYEAKEKEKKENRKFKAKMPKHFKIQKKKINIIQFQELMKQNKNQEIEYKKGGCICWHYKNKS